MPSRSRSRSFSRGRASKRFRSRSASRGSGMYAAALGSPARASARRNRVRAQGVHAFSRHCAAQELSLNGTFLSRQYEIKFEDMIQSADFTALFDSYRILKVTYTFQLINVPESYLYANSSNTSANVNGTNWYPKLWYVTDYDGGSTETLNSIRERQGVKCRILQPNSVVKITFMPKCRILTYKTTDAAGDITEGYGTKSIKIDMNDTDVPHYGLACVFDTNGLDPNDSYPFKINLERKITFKCYGVR